MNINRNNYEEFFLLYADGELGEAERMAVEAFAAKHPDLAEELQLLMETKLTPDSDEIFTGKNLLLKPEQWDADALTPVQMQMLDLLHGEGDANGTLQQSIESDPELQMDWALLHASLLSADDTVPMQNKHLLIKAVTWDAENMTSLQQQMLEVFEQHGAPAASWMSDPELAKDWMLLQQSRLPVETVAMPGKEKLLRKEKVEAAPIVRLTMLRIVAVAAVLFGIGWFVVTRLADRNAALQQTNQAISKQQPKSNIPVVPPVKKPAEEQMVNPQTAAPVEPILASNTQEKKTVRTINTTKQEVPEVSDENDTKNAIASFRLSEEDERTLKNRQASNPVNVLNEDAPVKVGKMNTTVALTASGNVDNQPKAQYALANDQERDEDAYISIGGAKLNKQKFRNVFRTVTRTVSRSLDKSTVAPAEERGTSSME